MLALNNPKLNSSFSTLNAEKVETLNNLILNSITQFNLKFKEINDNLMELKLEFLNHINSVQNLLNNQDDEDIMKFSKTPRGDSLFRDINYKSESLKNINFNIKKSENNDEKLYKRFIHRKKTFTQDSKNFKLNSILFNREKRDDIGKKNVSFLLEQINKSPKRYKEKKIQKKNENQNIEQENNNQNIENNKNNNNDNKNNNNDNKNNNNNNDNNNNNNDNKNNNNDNKNEDNSIELLSKNLINNNNTNNKKKEKQILNELDLNNLNNNNKDNLEDDSLLTSEEEFSKNENVNEELNKTIFPSKTSQSGINFITKKKEEQIYSDTSNLGKKLCNLLYVLLENEDKYDNNKTLKDLFYYLFNNFNVKSIKDLFLKTIYPKVYINENISEELFINVNKLVCDNLKEIKLICQIRNQPLSWIAINILEINRYFQMLFSKEK